MHIILANIYVYDAIATAAGILSNGWTWAVKSHFVFDRRKSQKGDFFLQLTIRQMHELALQHMQWQRQTEGVGPSKTPV